MHESHYLANGIFIEAFYMANNEKLVGVTIIMDQNTIM